MAFNYSLIKKYESWIRPSDWYDIPNIISGEEVIYLLQSVYDFDGNYAAVNFEGDYTVDWGDGTIEDVGSGVTAEHIFVYDNCSGLTSFGYKQSLIKITPQAGQHITKVDLTVKHSSLNNGRASQFIEMIFNIPNVSGTNLNLGQSSTIRHRTCVRVYIKEIGLLTTCRYLYNYFIKLEKVELFDTSNITDMSYMFNACYSLLEIPNFNTSNVEDMSYMFTNSNLREFKNFDTSNVTDMSYMFQYDRLIRNVNNIDFSNVEDLTQTFYGNYSLEKIEGVLSKCKTFVETFKNGAVLQSVYFTNCSTINDTTDCFLYCLSLKQVILSGITVGFSVESCSMSATDLNNMFSALGTAAGVQSINIKNNIGTSTCDTSIATGKGYTVITI